MNTYKKWGGIVLLVVIVIVAIWFFVGAKFTKSFTVDSAFLPKEWQYSSLYTSPDQIAKIENNIKGFQERTGATAEEKYDLALTIAQEYMRIGKGKEAYEYLLKAEKIDPVNSVTYQTMGGLFEALKAYDAAEQALKKGIEAQPHIPQNHFALISFYKKQGKEATLIDETFTKSFETTGRNINLLKEYAQWLEDEKRYRDALDAWEEVFKRTPNSEVERKISQLKLKAK